ncbi:MAG: class B sortase [Mycoplasma sp.]|nr:class B sortase [Mycoplasma sp.]
MIYLNHMENVVIKKRKKLNVKNLCLLIFFLVMLIVFLFSLIKVIMWIIDNSNTNDIIKKVANTYEISEKNYDNEVIINENEKDIYFDYMNLKFIDVDINKLKTFNPDTIGFIKVMGTNINYPFVQTIDNDYYLNRSYDKTYNNAGWIFLDYRNNEFNDKNTIIYGHGRINGTMFGSLKDTLKSSWQNNKDNYIIKISTEKENSIWQIFSVYKIATTSDYLQTTFSDNEFESFISLIKGRSSYNFETNVTNEDKVLTLSTCYNDNDKMVVHAKLIKYVQK